jgi:hypothetical protein
MKDQISPCGRDDSMGGGRDSKVASDWDDDRVGSRYDNREVSATELCLTPSLQPALTFRPALTFQPPLSFHPHCHFDRREKSLTIVQPLADLPTFFVIPPSLSFRPKGEISEEKPDLSLRSR